MAPIESPAAALSLLKPVVGGDTHAVVAFVESEARAMRAAGVTSQLGYLRMRRRGRPVRLTRHDRQLVWAALQSSTALPPARVVRVPHL